MAGMTTRIERWVARFTVILACCVAALSAQAQSALARMREIDPELRISNLAEIVPFRAAQDVARYVEGLRKAGLRD